MNRYITRTTIHDIARELKVTSSTVSRALNEHPSISTATKKAVKRIAKKLDYQHNKIASSLRLGKSRIIGVIIPSAEINFFGSVVHGIEKVASEKDYNVLMYQSNELIDYEKKGVETFLRSRVDGVLASISKETTNLSHFLKIKRRGVPLVLFDRASDFLGVPYVVVNDYLGAYKATQHLLDQGCRKIAHISGQLHVPIFKQRLSGYLDALRENNIAINEDLIINGSVTVDSGRECMNQLLSSGDVPDGVFAVEDFTALGAMQALKAKGISIPEEIAIIGFANEAFGQFISPSLSTVDQQTIRMGEEAAKLFFELTATDNFYGHKECTRILEPVLIYRNSSIKKKISR
ncbi:MAG: LacI family DNA-binding transcriptional regulator [Flavisolibacter sp.]